MDIVSIGATLATPTSGGPLGSSSSWDFNLYIRLFAPRSTFGGEFSTDLNASSRIAFEATLHAPDLSVENYSVGSSPSHWGMFTAKETPTASVGWQPGHVEVNLAGANPLVPFAPNIDPTLEIFGGGTSGGNLCVSGDLSGDAFPDAEVFTRSIFGKTTSLIQFRTGGRQDNGPALFLPGLNGLPMGSFQNVCIGQY